MSADPQNGIVWPLLLHFHGWGGDASECGQTCRSVIPSRGIITVALTGVVGSWNGVGTAASPGPDGATCQDLAHIYIPKPHPDPRNS